MEEVKSFATNLTPEVVAPIYDHGFTEEEVRDISEKRKKIDLRDLDAFPVTSEEFKNVIVPYLRITRTTAFILNPVKEKKEKVAKVPKEKVVKPKKLTKKYITDTVQGIIFKRAAGMAVTEEEEAFFKEHYKPIGLL